MSGDDDPHIHVEDTVIHGDAVARDMLASTFGLAADEHRELAARFRVHPAESRSAARAQAGDGQ